MRILVRQGEPAMGEQIVDLSPVSAAWAIDRGASSHEVYAEQWLAEGGIRANFVSSVDGAVSVSGLSRGLQTPGDHRVFGVIRDLADVVLVGAATAAAERYRQPPISPARSAIRARFGMRDVLGVALVSRSLRIDTTMPLLSQRTTPPPLLLTCEAAGSTALRQQLAEHAEIIDCGTEEIDLKQVRNLLAERGLTRVACEGGPTLFAALAQADVLDELCLSVSPLLVGPGPGRITEGKPWPDTKTTPLALHTLLEEDGALFYRYRATTSS